MFIYIYTDGSKIENLAIFAVALSSQTLNGELPVAASIFTSEMYAIKAATEKFTANSSPGSYAIFSDSESVLLAHRSITGTSNSAMVTEIQLLVYYATTKEMGVVGNKNANTSAKSATTSVDR